MRCARKASEHVTNQDADLAAQIATRSTNWQCCNVLSTARSTWRRPRRAQRQIWVEPLDDVHECLQSRIYWSSSPGYPKRLRNSKC